ncbi:MAG: hypothetical protein SW833_19060 [Cyanobacteriota bacterium]|nr:hypothetical protein [Cyanobacteriota bacterium]
MGTSTSWQRRIVALLALVAIAIAGVTVARGETTVTIPTNEIVERDLYSSAKTVTLDGTVQGNAFVAAEVITLNGTVEGDVYLAAEKITIDGTVEGDAVLAGRSIRIDGTVEEDAIAFAQAVEIDGTVGDDVRLAGEVLRLNPRARIGDDAIATGYSIESQVGSIVKGNFNLSGARALLAGTVERNVVGALSSVALHGLIDGDATLTVGNDRPFRPPFLPPSPIASAEIPAGLTVANSTAIGGNFTYRVPPDAARVDEQAQFAGEVVREPGQGDRKWIQAESGLAIAIASLQRFATLAALGIVLLQLKPHWLQILAQTVKGKAAASLGWGVLSGAGVALVAIAITLLTAVAIFLLTFTFESLILPILGLGILANLALLVSFGSFIGFVPPIVLSYLGGRAVLQNVKFVRAQKDWVALCVGLVGFIAIAALPIVGTIFNGVAICLGLGALALWAKQQRASHLPLPQPKKRYRIEKLPVSSADGEKL